MGVCAGGEGSGGGCFCSYVFHIWASTYLKNCVSPAEMLGIKHMLLGLCVQAFCNFTVLMYSYLVERGLRDTLLYVAILMYHLLHMWFEESVCYNSLTPNTAIFTASTVESKIALLNKIIYVFFVGPEPVQNRA